MRHRLQIALVVLFAGGLLAFFLRNVNLSQVWEATLKARLDLIALTVALTTGAYVIRIERWRRLLNTIGGASFRNAGRATIIGFSTNALVPGRLGEVVRPYLVAKRENLSVSSAIATVVLERLLDLLAIVIGVSACLIFFDKPTRDTELLGLVRTGAILSGAVAVAGFVGILWLAHRAETVDRLVQRMAHIAPGGVVRIITAFIQRFLAGLELVRRPSQVLTAAVLSLALWACLAASIWTTSLAFGIDITFGAGVILTGLTALGMAVPTPAGVGGYHAAYKLGATGLYGADTEAAVGAALVAHVIAFGPITLLGLALMAHEGLRLTTLTALSTGPTPSPGNQGGAG